MKIHLKVLFVVSVALILNSCKKPDKTELSSNTSKTIKEKRIILNDNKDEVVEYSLVFKNAIETDNDSRITRKINLTNTTGAMISAYSLDTSEYEVSFRTLEDDVWSEWSYFKINHEVKNPNRKVFSPNSLTNHVSKIEFKSSKPISNPVIFRVFKFLK
ncbi:hypothetical protein LX97_00910 [Nonlabens dokdonensis]|jgi:hypothetical protein|uniref:Uncharacterized protein n=2 Tax=Nonlabens dokdonensis TaxID=328515 RepID=L7W8V4_NONDD|nr:hypothetical protein [Nonlabens dokdonensis]AGC76241.1 hypothetical protein DDD_1114 [Nonlabens dokdonensis DSW-6]PZX43905.1 hypothetical protein LX97_00910 [Nonlabens dokdonensis]